MKTLLRNSVNYSKYPHFWWSPDEQIEMEITYKTVNYSQYNHCFDFKWAVLAPLYARRAKLSSETTPNKDSAIVANQIQQDILEDMLSTPKIIINSATQGLWEPRNLICLWEA